MNNEDREHILIGVDVFSAPNAYLTGVKNGLEVASSVADRLKMKLAGHQEFQEILDFVEGEIAKFPARADMKNVEGRK